jgi:phage tail P2-like protein
MNANEIEFIKMLPHWMRTDRADIGLARASDEQIRAMAKAIALLSIWDKIDSLPDEYLELLAWQLDITWYQSEADRETRIKIIRESDRMHQLLGSKAAVENILSTYFGKVTMQEWFEYGGTHDHFTLNIPNIATLDKYEDFMRVLNAIKRASSVFDGYLVGFKTNPDIYAGAAWAEYTHETYSAVSEVSE